MDAYTGPAMTNPTIREYNTLLELPMGSLIDSHGEIFEKTMTHEGHDATFIRLSDTKSCIVIDAKELQGPFIESEVKLLRIGDFAKE